MHAKERRPLIHAAAGSTTHDFSFLGEAGWRMLTTRSAREADRLLRVETVYAAILDLSAGYRDQDLAAYARSMRALNAGWVAAVTQAQLGDPQVRRLIHDYCFDYLTLPSPRDLVASVVGHAYGMAGLCRETVIPASGGAPGEFGMIGSSETMQRLFRSVRKIAATEAPAFIAGETGTGKELTAQAIHQQSTRADKPFVAINCGAIPSHLVQSELFGYERGAFTGANQRKIGRIEAANGGTLFLDEIGDLPLECQVSLLRFLQQGAIERLGGHVIIPVDVRVISATHVDLEEALRSGRFRSDLYHRLCVLRIDEPPLRARGKDIELLAQHALRSFAAETQRRIDGFTPCAIASLHAYRWPGNVRELLNCVRRAVVMAESRRISAWDLNLQPTAETSRRQTLDEARGAAERTVIEQGLLRNGQRLSETARELGISRVTLYRLMCRHGLREDTLICADEARLAT